MLHSKPAAGLPESKEVADAYKDIAGFFDYYALPQARQRLQACMKTAHRRRGCKGREASDVLYFFERLDHLVEAAFVLVQSDCKRPKALREPCAAPDIAQYRDYCGWSVRFAPWDYFPRFLSAREYFDPYRALQKVTTHCFQPDWKDIFRTLLYSVLGRERLQDFDEELNTHRLFILLNKLLEAAHLIEVRAITEVDGRPLRKWEREAAAASHQRGVSTCLDGCPTPTP